MRFRSSLSLFALFTLGAGFVACSKADDGFENTEDAVTSAQGEQLERNEATLVREIADAATEQVIKSQSTSPDHVAKRDAHPKAHGCVTATFDVDPSAPAEFAVGSFTRGAHYDAWIRFSNGSQADDRSSDARGMAIKLLNATGTNPRLLDSEPAGSITHDIVLTNYHTFFMSNLADYSEFMKTVTEKGNPISFFINWNPFDLHLHAALLAKRFTGQPISNPTSSRYWSATPYALGGNVVKYSAIPCGGVDASGAHADDPNYLSAALKAGLAGGGACFDFMVQKRVSNYWQPVEDSTYTWDEGSYPFVKIARINIAAQTFDGDAQKQYCENLSFSPWHATPTHKPLGSMNRTRKVVYEATSAARHRLNGVTRSEPTDLRVP